MPKYLSLFFTQDTQLFSALSQLLEDEGPQRLVDHLDEAGCLEDGEELDFPPNGTGDHLYRTRGGYVVTYRPSLGYLGVHQEYVN